MSEKRSDEFPTTRWTLVARLRSVDTSVARRALGDIIVQYRYTLYAYIRRRGLSHHDAEDALQEFLLKLLRAQAFETAEEERGRLRGYLATALGNFLTSWHRSESRRAEADRELPTESARAAAGDEARYARERFTDKDSPKRVFERKWGQALMARVMARLKERCWQEGKGALFSALEPVLVGGGSLRGHDVGTLAKGLGMSEGALRVALSRHLRDYRALLEEEVRQTVEDPKDIPAEIEYLKSIFTPESRDEGAKPGKPGSTVGK